ncbi:MAG: radical SAM protein [Lachnospiraceae bacterium]|nr:radical SAM protein [Lachnospiraceae bacterium]
MVREVTPDLRILLVEVTQKCNASCDHCGSRCDIHSAEVLTAEDILGVFRDVRDNIGTDVMINITGGEPLMRRDLFDIMGQAHDMGFDWGMVTNGSMIDDNIIEKMRSAGMRTITISLDGLAHTHETIRHLPGSFERIMKSLKKLKDAAFLDCVQVTFTSNRKNYREFPKLYERLEQIGIDSVRTSIIDPIGRACDHSELLMGREEIRFMMDFANRVNAAGRMPVIWGCPHFLGDKLENRHFFCFAGIYAASILYNGDIFVCPNVPRRPELIQGNIKTERFSEVWKNGYDYFRHRVLPEKCETCKYRDDCAGDSLHTFDFDRKAPNFCYKEIFDVNIGKYENWLKKHYGSVEITEISPDEPAPAIYIEPGAYEEIKSYFHMGVRHPLSMFEQQMGLVGFKVDGDYIVRYAFPSVIEAKAADLAVFTPGTLSHARKQTAIIKRNVMHSDWADMPGNDRLRFLGFIHSHPMQEELCYSVGDEIIHKSLYKKFGDYIGLLVNPEHDLIGAYVGGDDIVQGNLKIVNVGD